MRSRISAIRSLLTVGTSLLFGALALAAPAGATPAPRVISHLSGWVSSLNPTGGGGFNAAISSFANNNEASIVPFDSSGVSGTPTVITTTCNRQVSSNGVVAFGPDTTSFAFITTDGDLWVTVDGTQHFLESLPANYFVNGITVSDPSAAGAHTVYISLDSTLDSSAALEVLSFDATGTVLDSTTITDPALSGLDVPTWTSAGILVPSWTGALYRIDPSGSSGTVTTLLPVGSLDQPRSAAVDAQGNIYVIENGTDSLTQVHADGSMSSVLIFGTPGGAAGAPTRGAPANGQFGTALAFDPSTRSLLLARQNQSPPTAQRRCFLANLTTTILRVGTAPLAPVSPNVIASGTSATISWTSSADQVAGDVYSVTASPGGGTCSAVAPSTSCTISGLNPQTSYSFSVLAQSAEGIGAATATITAITAPSLAATGSSTGLLGMVGLLTFGGGLALTNLRRRLVAHR